MGLDNEKSKFLDEEKSDVTQDVLGRIAISGESWEIREDEAKHLTKQSILLDIVGNPKEDYRVRAAAVGNITNDSALKNIGRFDIADDVRKAAKDRYREVMGFADSTKKPPELKMK